MSLIRRFASGALWAVIGNAANNIISFIVFAIVARIVSPEVLGVAAFTIVIVELGKQVAVAGTADLLVQRAEWSDDYAAVAFWVNVTIAVLLTGLACFILAPLLEAQFSPGSGVVMTAISVCFVIDAMRVVHESKLRREFKYKNLAARGSSAGILSGIVGVTLVSMGFGIWGLVGQRIASSVFTTLFTWIASDWMPRLYWSTRELPSMLAHGMRLMGAALLAGLSMRVPDLVLGSLVGPAAVALYRVGARGFEALYQLIVVPLSAATTGGFSRIADKQTTGGAYVRATKFAALIAYPTFFGAAAIAEPFVRIVFGVEWEASARIMAIISLTAGPAVLGYMLYPALTALGRTHAILWISIGSVVSSIVVCLVATPGGAFAIAVALAIRAYLAGACNVFLAQRLLGVDARQLLARVVPPFISAVVMAGAVLAVGRLLLAGYADWVSVPVMVAVGGIVYPAMVWLFWRRYLHGALEEIGTMFPQLQRVLARVPGVRLAP